MDNYNETIGNAIKSLYRFIMLINQNSRNCRIYDCNDELHHLSKYDGNFDIFCEYLYRNVHPIEREAFMDFTKPDHLPGALEKKVYTSMDCRIRTENGSYRWFELIFCNATEEDRAGGDEHLFLMRDIHRKKVLEISREAKDREMLHNLEVQYKELFEENMKDFQTGFYNRKGLNYYMSLVIKEAAAPDRELFVCMVDLNSPKYRNDTFGHQAGDEAIKVVSEAIAVAAPKGARIVRNGGDEFVIFAAISVGSNEPEEMGRILERELEEYNSSHENPYEIGASYGWVVSGLTEDIDDLDKFINIADQRMYEMKETRDKHRRK
ncbi:MAG: GGDEF domain-containing protein [Lachnospiraceae bacterium]|nr:GGDEF domain-containing protein [Lachnospiraceae bacterium]